LAEVAGGDRPESSEGGYLRGVWSELRKTVWPTWPELRQMTGVVIVTVVLLGAFLGLLDFGLTSLLKPLYTASATATATPAPTSAPATTVTPTPSPSASP
jgi:preprotein translocase subunit SecE